MDRLPYVSRPTREDTIIDPRIFLVDNLEARVGKKYDAPKCKKLRVGRSASPQFNTIVQWKTEDDAQISYNKNDSNQIIWYFKFVCCTLDKSYKYAFLF